MNFFHLCKSKHSLTDIQFEGSSSLRESFYTHTMSYISQAPEDNTLWQGEITHKVSTFSSKKLFAVLLKGDSHLYMIDAKLLPKKRPTYVSPFTRELRFNESTKSMGILAQGWRKLDLRRLHICTSTRDSKIFKILIPSSKKGTAGASSIIKERYWCKTSCLRKIWIKKLNQAKSGLVCEPIVPLKPKLISFDSDEQ